MDALHVLKEGIVAAVELLALALVPPAFSAEPADLRIESSRLVVVVDDGIAQLHVQQRVRNAGPAIVDLAAQLPAVDDDMDSLRVVRGSRSIDLAARDSGCGEPFGSDEAAHVRLALDEAIADTLLLPSGESATIEASATRPFATGADVQRLLVPWMKPPAMAQLTVDDAQRLIVVPPAAARGPATLRLRPHRGSALAIDLGSIDQPGTAFVVAVDRALLLTLADGAVELETRDGDELQWATLLLPAAHRANPLVVDVQR